MNDEQYLLYRQKIDNGEPVSQEERIAARQYLLGLLDMESSQPTPQTFEEKMYAKLDLNIKPTPQDPGEDLLTRQARARAEGQMTRMESMYTPAQVGDELMKDYNKPLDTNIADSLVKYMEKQRFDINKLPMLYPGGTDLSTELFTAGRALGMEKGTPGRGLTLGSSIGAAALGATRDFLSGLSYEKQQNIVRDWYRDRQQDNFYTPSPQTRNTNTVGNMPFKFGGEFYQDGGETMQPQVSSEQQQVMQQIQQEVVGMLQEGAQPEQIVQALVQNGVPQEQAVMIVEQTLMQLQQQMPQEMLPDQQMPTQQQAEPQQGGLQVGQDVSFKFGGKKVSGKIKKIENGKIYL